jgi:hypothetical protein
MLGRSSIEKIRGASLFLDLEARFSFTWDVRFVWLAN